VRGSRRRALRASKAICSVGRWGPGRRSAARPRVDYLAILARPDRPTPCGSRSTVPRRVRRQTIGAPPSCGSGSTLRHGLHADSEGVAQPCTEPQYADPHQRPADAFLNGPDVADDEAKPPWECKRYKICLLDPNEEVLQLVGPESDLVGLRTG
jgi:hypothetical protein